MVSKSISLVTTSGVASLVSVNESTANNESNILG